MRAQRRRPQQFVAFLTAVVAMLALLHGTSERVGSLIAMWLVPLTFAAHELSAERYSIVERVFVLMHDHDGVAYLIDGALLATSRQGYLNPWEHDVDIAFYNHHSRELFFRIVVPALDAEFGQDVWSRHLSGLEVRRAPSRSCSWNAALSNPAERGVFQTKASCRAELHVEDHDAAASWADVAPSEALQAVVLRDPRGLSARVMIPRQPERFLAIYGPDAFERCRPDIRRRAADGREVLNAWALPFFWLPLRAIRCADALSASLGLERAAVWPSVEHFPAAVPDVGPL